MSEKVPLPKWILWVRAARAVLGVVVLGLCAYSLQIIAMRQAGFNIFVGLITVLVTVYFYVAEIAVPKAYNKWVILVLELVTLLFWLAGFASLAALAANIDSCIDLIESGFTNTCVAVRSKRDLAKRSGTWDVDTGREWYSALAAASGIGALCFVLSIVISSIFILAIRRHSADPAAGNPGAAEAAYPLQIAAAPEKTEQTVYSAPQAQPYNAPYQQQHHQQQHQQPPQQAQSPYPPTNASQSQWTPTPPSSPPPQQTYPQPHQPMGYAPQPVQPHQQMYPQHPHSQYTNTTTYSELGNNPAPPPGRTELGDSR